MIKDENKNQRSAHQRIFLGKSWQILQTPSKGKVQIVLVASEKSGSDRELNPTTAIGRLGYNYTEKFIVEVRVCIGLSKDAAMIKGVKAIITSRFIFEYTSHLDKSDYQSMKLGVLDLISGPN